MQLYNSTSSLANSIQTNNTRTQKYLFVYEYSTWTENTLIETYDKTNDYTQNSLTVFK